MSRHNAANERIKRQYFLYLREAMGQSEASVDAVAKALARFEAHSRYRDFKAFHFEQAVAFKRWLAEQESHATGERLSKATLHGTQSHLKRFFHWLAGQPGYKSRLRYADANYFNAPEKDVRVATARRSRQVPTLDQLMHVIRQMPSATLIEQRNRALLAFVVLTGARDSAVASARLRHVDLIAGCFYQDAREVNTKFSKTFTTMFFPVGDELRQILCDWIACLRQQLLWGEGDPLFPKSAPTLGKDRQFEHVELSREQWATASPIRAIFKASFATAGLPYYNPHSVRHMLAQMAERTCQSPEEFKAWSQNLGHEGVLTTFYSYGTVPDGRQREIMRGFDRRVGGIGDSQLGLAS